ncbi:hypothetical protein [Caldalkalibacillus mannanilyticus]|uniref:hypothetical protein n=1 Tax=Caldalkalibacillus mannanilyticus TaxID=1418 RepID=UPI0011DE59A9|nr:hypothetical protein [Caldalkalibacillus mannanilyticus]
MKIVKTKESQEFSCLGEQMADILSVINTESRTLYWYVFDVDYYNHSEEIFKSPISRFDCTEDLINASKKVEQFLSCVFIATKHDNIQWDMEKLPKTEEDKGLQHEEALIEIRAFDTTYFEVYVQEFNVANRLKLAFKIYCT